MRQKYFITSSRDELEYHFFHYDDGTLCYRIIDKLDYTDLSLDENVICDQKVIETYITICDKNIIHLLVLTQNGDLKYYNNINNAWNERLLSRFEQGISMINSLYIKAINDKLYVFYTSNSSMSSNLWTIHFKYWNGTEWKSSNIGMTTSDNGSDIYRISIDSQSNFHMIYKNENSKGTQIFYRKYHFQFSLWSSPEKIINSSGRFLGYSILCDAEDKLHLVWSEIEHSDSRIMYKKLNPKVLNHKYMSKTVPLNKSKNICSDPIIFENENKKWCMWIDDKDLCYCEIIPGGPVPGMISVIQYIDRPFTPIECINIQNVYGKKLKSTTLYGMFDRYLDLFVPERIQIINFTPVVTMTNTTNDIARDGMSNSISTNNDDSSASDDRSACNNINKDHCKHALQLIDSIWLAIEEIKKQR
jgi:hypothetical protein